MLLFYLVKVVELKVAVTVVAVVKVLKVVENLLSS